MRNVRGAVAAAAVTVMVLAGTSAPAVADDCANAAFRTGASAGLPDCRALERASTPDNNGNNVSDLNVVAAPVGGRALFLATGALGEADGVPFFSAYSAARAADGWTTQPIDPPLSGSFFTNNTVVAYADDGTKALVLSRDALTPGAIQDGTNLYVRDLTQRRSYTLVAAKATGALFGDNTSNGSILYAGAATDFSTIAIASATPLEPGSPETADPQSHLYRWTARDGLSRIADTVANMEIDRRGRVVSADGRRITWLAGGEVYQDAGGTTTQVSRPRDPRAVPGTAARPIASDDGRQVTFPALTALTPESTDSQASVYRWDADGDRLTDLLAGVDGIVARGNDIRLAEVSDDGRFVWLTSGSQLTADAPAGDTGLYVLDLRANALRLVFSGPTTPTLGFSPRRHAVALLTDANDTPGVPAGCDAPGGCREGAFVYVADAASPRLQCAACGALGTTGLGATGTALARQLPTPVLDDGRTFFDATAPLTPGDTNASADVYEFTPGVGLRLISSGNGASPAKFGDAGGDGQDVFFTTADPLVPSDTDAQVDLYDARVGGGLAAQQIRPDAAAPCLGDGCRPAPSAPTGATSIATNGPAVPAPPRAPSFTVLRRTARRDGVDVRVKAGGAGRLAASLRGRLGGKRIRNAALTSTRLTRAGTATLRLRLSKTARRALRRSGKLSLTLTVAYSERTTRYRKTITLRRSGSSGKGGRR